MIIEEGSFREGIGEVARRNPPRAPTAFAASAARSPRSQPCSTRREKAGRASPPRVGHASWCASASPPRTDGVDRRFRVVLAGIAAPRQRPLVGNHSDRKRAVKRSHSWLGLSYNLKDLALLKATSLHIRMENC